MTLPADLYPLGDQQGNQIDAEFIRPTSISTVAFNSTTGTALDTTLVADDEAVIFYTDQTCIVTFSVIATKTPNNVLGFLLTANERGSIIIPQGITATGISVIGLANSGTLYLQKITKWAGVGNAGSGVI